jgi:hypothetical protein
MKKLSNERSNEIGKLVFQDKGYQGAEKVIAELEAQLRKRIGDDADLWKMVDDYVSCCNYAGAISETIYYAEGHADGCKGCSEILRTLIADADMRGGAEVC